MKLHRAEEQNLGSSQLHQLRDTPIHSPTMPPRPPLTRVSRRLPLSRPLPSRHQSTTTSPASSQPQQQQQQQPTYNPHDLLSKPTWSIRTLLPPILSSSSSQTSQRESEITPTTLTHLHRLSALPPPQTPSSTAAILSTLHSQLHFVQHIQLVDTSNVAPLSSIRDETDAGLAEARITTETLAQELAEEEVVGRCKRPRRRRQTGVKGGEGGGKEGDWDPLGCASEKAGRYFVVRSGKTAVEA